MTQLTSEKVLKLIGAKDLKLTPPQKKYIIESAQRLIKEYGEKWLEENQARLRAELDVVFKEI